MVFDLRIKLLLLFSVLTAITLGNLATLLSAEQDATEQHDWVHHTHEVLKKSYTFQGHLRDAETGQRGFLLTHQKEYLEPYYTGLAKARSDFSILNQLTQDNPTQQYRLADIQKLMSTKFVELKKTIQLTQQGRMNEALAIVNSGEGKQIMDNLRDQIHEFNLEEERLLKPREEEFATHQQALRVLFGMEALLLLAIIITVTVYIQKTIVQPITRLTKNATTLGADKDVEFMPSSGNDEIGRLVNAFNSMTQDVRNRTQELKKQAHFTEAFSQIVSTCASSHDLNKNLLDALIIHSANHPSPLSVIYLYNKKTGMLHRTAGHGTMEDLADIVSAETGLIGQTYKTNESLLVDADSADGFLTDAGLAKLRPRAIVLEPINYGEKRLGVLILAYTAQLTDQDRQYIASIALQFGITVVNAQQYKALQELTLELKESGRKVTVERDQAVMASYTDSLTTLHNRGYLESELERMIAQCTRYDYDLSMIMLDIDHFKQINDTLGHQAGDDVLRALGAILQRETRSSDLVARYGGDEFIIALPQTSLHKAQHTAEKLRKIIETLNIPAMDGETITISLGVATLNKNDEDMESSIFARVDMALYQAKNKGRNQVSTANIA